MATGYVNPAAPLTPTLPGTAPGDLNRKQNRTLQRYQLRTTLGHETGAARAAKRLQRMGVNASETVAGFADPASLADSALARIANQGALGGKRAKRLNAQIIENENLAEIDNWGQAAMTYGTDEIGGQYGEAAGNLKAILGPDVDLSSPAVASVLAGLMEGRSTSSQDYLNRLQVMQGQAKNQAREGIGLGVIGQTLDETGALVEALKRLKDEQSDLAAAQRGSIYGGLLNPARAFGSGVGAIAGGRQGAASGGNAGAAGFAELLAAIQAITSMGNGGGLPTPGGSGSGGPVFAP